MSVACRILRSAPDIFGVVRRSNVADKKLEECQLICDQDRYETSILPTVRHSVEAAWASYLAGRLDFLRLVESKRQLLEMKDRFYETVAEYRRRLTELSRLIGASPFLPAASALPVEC